MTKRPIIVIKKKITRAEHHGGAWKVAYADFVTALMSLFIVLWLLNSTPQVKKAVAGYFNDPKGVADDTGTDKAGAGPNLSVDEANVQKLKEQIERAILQQKDLDKLSKHVEITITNEGLRIELIEDQNGTFFERGSAQLSVPGVKLVKMLAAKVKPLPNSLVIEGHTDAQPFLGVNGYTNWELSADRANAARRLLQQEGVMKGRISEVRGFADQSLRVPTDPMDPSNRRISLIIKWVEVPAVVVVKAAVPKFSAAAAETSLSPGEKTSPVIALKGGLDTSSAAPPSKAGMMYRVRQMMMGVKDTTAGVKPVP